MNDQVMQMLQADLENLHNRRATAAADLAAVDAEIAKIKGAIDSLNGTAAARKERRRRGKGKKTIINGVFAAMMSGPAAMNRQGNPQKPDQDRRLRRCREAEHLRCSVAPQGGWASAPQ
jgi:hypothetical protein